MNGRVLLWMVECYCGLSKWCGTQSCTINIHETLAGLPVAAKHIVIVLSKMVCSSSTMKITLFVLLGYRQSMLSLCLESPSKTNRSVIFVC